MIVLLLSAALAGVEPYIEAEMRLNQIPGLSLAVVRGEEVLLSRAWGVRSLATREAMRVDTPVDLASVSKSFTALAVRQLHLDLDAPIERYLPEYRAGRGRLTLRRLLRQTSGLTRREDRQVPGDASLAESVRRLETAGLRRAPGAAFQYANSNYILLAAIVERVSGRPFAAYLREQVFAPLGMTRTTLDDAEGLAEYHEAQWGRVRPSPSGFRGWPGASGVKSSADEMARYAIASLRTADAAWAAPYEMGWFVRPQAAFLGGRRVLEHSGDIWGANTAVALAPELRLGVVVLINAGVNRAGEIARGVLARAAGLPGPPPRARPFADSPDNWAICFAVAAAAIFAFLALRLRRLRLGWPRDRLGRWRAALLTAMAFYLLILLGLRSRLLPSLPTTLQTAVPLLTAAVIALLLMAAATLRSASPRK